MNLEKRNKKQSRMQLPGMLGAAAVAVAPRTVAGDAAAIHTGLHYAEQLADRSSVLDDCKDNY